MLVKHNYLNVALLKKGYPLDYIRTVLAALDTTSHYEDGNLRIDKTEKGYIIR